MASIEGTNNFKRQLLARASGVLLSREFGEHGAVYLEPFWVNNTNAARPEELVDDNNTFMIGLGARAAHPADGVSGGRSRAAGRRLRPGRRRMSASASRSAPAATPSS